MKVHYPHIGMLAQALKERRHFTIAEAMMARDILDEARCAALAYFKLPFADTSPIGPPRPDTNDPPADSREIASAKKRGLIEIGEMVNDEDSPLDPVVRSLLAALLPEAVNDYVHRPDAHRIARPTVSNALDADTAKRNASDAATRATLAAMEAQTQQNTALGARVEALAANVDTLAGMLHTLLGQLGSPAPSAPSAAPSTPSTPSNPPADPSAPKETKEGAK